MRPSTSYYYVCTECLIVPLLPAAAGLEAIVKKKNQEKRTKCAGHQGRSAQPPTPQTMTMSGKTEPPAFRIAHRQPFDSPAHRPRAGPSARTHENVVSALRRAPRFVSAVHMERRDLRSVAPKEDLLSETCQKLPLQPAGLCP